MATQKNKTHYPLVNKDKGNTMFVIRKDVPIPTTGKMYPFAQMEIGDSFEVTKNRASVSVSAINFAKRHGKKFMTRTDKATGVTTVWRIA